MGMPESTPAAALLHRDAYLTDLGRGSQPCSVFSRGNGPLFYSLSVASLLEATAASSADRLALIFGDDTEFRDWVRSDWQPGRLLRQHMLREYIVMTWPEFDWTAAHDRFREAHEPHRAHKLLSPGEEALKRCAASAQSALFYRCLGSWANEVRVRKVATRLAQEDAGAFQKFRKVYERSAREMRLGDRRSWRTTMACVQDARDVHVQTAFNALVQQWGPNTPFPALDYRQFIERMKGVIETHARPGWRERLVFREWAKAPKAARATAKARIHAWFKPVVTMETGRQPVSSRPRWQP